MGKAHVWILNVEGFYFLKLADAESLYFSIGSIRVYSILKEPQVSRTPLGYLKASTSKVERQNGE